MGRADGRPMATHRILFCDEARRFGMTQPDLVKTFAIPSPTAGGRAGRLVIGINPRRPFDDQYKSFFELVADQFGTALANARAYEQERQRAEALADMIARRPHSSAMSATNSGRR